MGAILATVLTLTVKRSGSAPNEIVCDVAILGAGFAGTFAAYQLANRSGSNVCLIEKLDRFGGRVFDVTGWSNGPAFGVGALRVIADQPTMLALAHELDIILEREESDNELMRVRGQYFYRDVSHNASESNQMCQKAFRNLTCEYPNFGNDTDKAILSHLLNVYNENKSIALEFPDFPTYILSTFGDEGLAFIRESVRYNSPFTSVSVHGIMDFFNNELRGKGLDPDRFYPRGGMSQYIEKMLAHSNRSKVKIFSGEPVVTIDFEQTVDSGTFLIGTPEKKFRAKSVLCAIDPLNLRTVKGNIADILNSAPELKVILPKKLAIVTAWWNERWWEKSLMYRNLSRIVSHENCFNTMDIPAFPYGRDQNVTRAVYDDGACLDLWDMLINGGNKSLLAKTVTSSLRNVLSDVEIPEPKAIHGFMHNNAWHFQVANSTISNRRIFEWSQNPIPGKNFTLIGEGYYLDFTAWCDGALKSAMWALTSHYNFTYPCLDDPGSPANCTSDNYQKISSNLQLMSKFLFG